MMTFEQALTVLKDGKNVARMGWNGTGMWLEIQHPDKHSKMTLPYVFLAYSDGETKVPWAASQTDLLSADWFELI